MAGSEADNPPEPNDPPVILSGRRYNPLVMGLLCPLLTDAQFDVVQALLEAGPTGLSMKQLATITGRKAPQTTAKYLKDSGPPWSEVIHLAGKPYGRYRIAWPEGVPRKNKMTAEMYPFWLEGSLLGNVGVFENPPQASYTPKQYMAIIRDALMKVSDAEISLQTLKEELRRIASSLNAMESDEVP
jgi:hypothetical protein